MGLSHSAADRNKHRAELIGKLQREQALLQEAWRRRSTLLAGFDRERVDLTLLMVEAARDGEAAGNPGDLNRPTLREQEGELRRLESHLADLGRREQELEAKASGFLAELDGRIMQTLAALRGG